MDVKIEFIVLEDLEEFMFYSYNLRRCIND